MRTLLLPDNRLTSILGRPLVNGHGKSIPAEMAAKTCGIDGVCHAPIVADCTEFQYFDFGDAYLTFCPKEGLEATTRFLGEQRDFAVTSFVWSQSADNLKDCQAQCILTQLDFTKVLPFNLHQSPETKHTLATVALVWWPELGLFYSMAMGKTDQLLFSDMDEAEKCIQTMSRFIGAAARIATEFKTDR